MKKLFISLTLSMTAVLSALAEPEITFDNTSYDFGTIEAADGQVKAKYTFTNTGNEPLIIVKVTNGGCGCTQPSYPTAPIKPGEKGEIVITFDPNGRAGELHRKVQVTTNTSQKRVGLKFDGYIIPKLKKLNY